MSKTKELPFILVGLLVIIHAVLRAWHVPITFDESTSYIFIRNLDADILSKTQEGDLTYITLRLNSFNHIRSANTHIINSILMKVCSVLFGDSEFSLRLPNLMALLLYVIFTYKILQPIVNWPVRFCAFALLNLNPLLLDFFALARGYGLAVAFLIISLYYFISFFSGKTNNLLRAYIFAMLATYANFIAFNFYVALVATNLFMLHPDILKWSSLKVIMARNRRLLAINAVFLLVTLAYLALQASTNQFYVGSSSIYNTFYSLSWATLYTEEPLTLAADALSVFSMVLFLVVTLLTFIGIKRAGKVQWYHIPALVTLVSFGVCLSQHLILKLPLPEYRTGIYFVPLFILSCVFVFLFGFKRVAQYGKYPAIAITILLIVAFAYGANTSYAMYTPYDAKSREAYAFFKQKAIQRNDKTKVNVFWILAEAMTYYQLTDNDSIKPEITPIWPWDMATVDTTACYYYFSDSCRPLMPVNTTQLIRFDKYSNTIKKRIGCE